jgi:hypothetical protein
MKSRHSGSSAGSGTTAAGSPMMDEDLGGRKAHKSHGNGKSCPPGLEKQGRC